MPPTAEITQADDDVPRASFVAAQHWETQRQEGHLIDETLVRAENEDKMTVYLAFLILSAALGGFLYGYDTV